MKRWGWVAWLAVVGFRGGVAPAFAGVVEQNVPLLFFQAGIFCNRPPDETKLVPTVRSGTVGGHIDLWDFVDGGDVVPAFPDLAVGFTVYLKAYTPREELLIEIDRLDDQLSPEWFPNVIRNNGSFMYGQAARLGKALQTGRYKVTVMRKDAVLLVYEYRVVPASQMPELKDICHPAVS